MNIIKLLYSIARDTIRDHGWPVGTICLALTPIILAVLGVYFGGCAMYGLLDECFDDILDRIQKVWEEWKK